MMYFLCWAEMRHIQLLTISPLCGRDIACCRPAWTRSCRWLSGRVAVRVLLRHESWLVVGGERAVAQQVPGRHIMRNVFCHAGGDSIFLQDDAMSLIMAASERDIGRQSVPW